MNIKTDGIILRETMTGEQDRLVTVLTRSNGVIKAFVNGARNPKNKNVSSTGLLCYSDFVIHKSQKGVYVIREATAKEMFFSLRSDIVNLSLAQYFAELTYELAPREESSTDYLSLLLNAIFLITKRTKENRLIKAATELRMLCLSGYMPSVVSCALCGSFESENMYFDLHTGEIFCDECQRASSLHQLSLTTVSAMRYICFSEAKKIYSFTIPKEDLEDLCFITEIYLKNITGRKYKTLDFYKTMTS